jgi:hypothetical protein
MDGCTGLLGCLAKRAEVPAPIQRRVALILSTEATLKRAKTRGVTSPTTVPMSVAVAACAHHVVSSRPGGARAVEV